MNMPRLAWQAAWRRALPALWLTVLPARAGEERRFFQMSEAEIVATLKRVHEERETLPARVEALSELFLDTPYRLGPLGEGEEGRFDRDPLISFKEADCTTLVEQVLALALEPDLGEAKRALQRIRYREGKIAYETRNHFPEADWIPENIRAGYLRDITEALAGAKTKQASKAISKRDWYAKKTLDDIQGFDPAPASDKEDRLKRLQALGQAFESQTSTLPYLPMDMLPEALPRIPSGTIANLVREDQPDKPVLISHQVFLIDKNGAKHVRHAAYGKKVEDVLALEYFYRYYNSKWRLLGLNLNQALHP